MYVGDAYELEKRDIHMGIDIQAPARTPVRAFYSGRIYGLKDNNQPLDYGPTIVTEHFINETKYWVLWGHLSRESLCRWQVGDPFNGGDEIATLGEPEVNGGWPSHLHFQVSLVEPDDVNFPGVVSEGQLEAALKRYPDPRCFLGPIY
ncbi:MAG: peptidoglycan DD-metalloendopeptidase family protein [Bdellovibrionales bacterium]